MKKIPNLNLIRAFAILTIVFSHASNWTPNLPSSISYIIYSGQVGVELFFALSGYLIGSSLLKEYASRGSVNIIFFLAKRGTRIFPPYFIALIVYAFGSYIIEGDNFRLEFIFLVQNYLYRIPYFLGSWALCIEAHFYIVLPLLYVLLDHFIFKLGRAFSAIVVSLIVSAPLIGRLIVQKNIYELMPFGFYQTATHLHYDAIAFGVLAAYAIHWRVVPSQKFNRIALIACSSFLIMGTFVLNLGSFRFQYVVAPSAIGILSAVLVLAFGEGVQFKLSSNYIVELLATTSFSIYLAHGIAIHATNICLNSLGLLEANDPAKFIIFVGVSIASGLLFYQFVEKPLDFRRDKLLAYMAAKNS